MLSSSKTRSMRPYSRNVSLLLTYEIYVRMDLLTIRSTLSISLLQARTRPMSAVGPCLILNARVVRAEGAKL